jgi:hypothetical protein
MPCATCLAVEVGAFYFRFSASGAHIPFFGPFAMHSPTTYRTLGNLRIDLGCLLFEQPAGDFFFYFSSRT